MKKIHRKYIGVKSWEFDVKARELSGNWKVKYNKLDYKSVAPILMYFILTLLKTLMSKYLT